MKTRYFLPPLIIAALLSTVLAMPGSRLFDSPAPEALRGDDQQGEMRTLKDRPAADGRDLYFVILEGDPVPLHLASQQRDTLAKNTARLNLSSPTADSYRRVLQKQQADIAAAIANLPGTSAEITHSTQLALNALLARMDANDAERVRQLPGVKQVERSEIHRLHTDRGPQHIRATDIWAGLPGIAATKGEGVIVGIIDTGIRTDHPSFADIGGDGHDHTNPLGAGNYLGDCIDNPSLCNDKVIGIVSYPEITDHLGTSMSKNGWDYIGHGTHVASTAAGNIVNDVPVYNVLGNPSDYTLDQISGVAPHANIISYQVCYQDGFSGCETSLTVLAVEHAIENGVDVINYSIGGGPASSWNKPDGMAFLSARAAGIHVATSAGNSGPNPGTVGTPATAPWLTAVAAFTHDRGFERPLLTNFAGGTTPPTAPFVGEALTAEYTGPVIDAADFGDGDCMQPFPAGTFSGEIVLCRRGEIARVEKGHNVLAGGAGGMILVNVSGGDTNVVSDPHELPAIHLDEFSGRNIIAWLAQGSGHTATITAAGTRENDALANRAAVFSSRGPAVPVDSIPSPHIAAPGVDIYAAWVENAPFRDNEATAPYAFVNGTSMASPHVAGAYALLAAARPEWTPAEAQSAIMLTANTDTHDENGNSSTLFDAGNGMLDVVAALSTGLVMDETEQDYRDADPEMGGEPENLNMAALANGLCLQTCSWTRTLKATRDGSWSVATSSSPEISITVDPMNFSLTTGQEQVLTVSVTLTAAEIPTDWIHGRISLQPSDPAISAASLPLAVNFDAGTVPEFVTRNIGRDAGETTLNGFRSVGTDTLTLSSSGLVPAELHEAYLSGDPTPGNPFDNIDSVVHVITVNVDTSTRTLIAEILEAESPDLDLFIARDFDFDGRPSGWELGEGELCISGSPTSDERCVVHNPPPGTYWIAVQNYKASSPDASDRHVLSVALIDDIDEGITLEAPASVQANTPWWVDVSWDYAMEIGGSYYAVIAAGTSPDFPDNIGRSVLRLDRLEDDFTVNVASNAVLAGDPVAYEWRVAGLPTTSAAMTYAISVPLPEGYAASTDRLGEIVGGHALWEVIQAPGSTAKTGTLTLETERSDGGKQIELSFTQQANDLPPLDVAAAPVSVLSLPEALIEGSSSASLTVTENKVLEIDASASHPGDTGMLFSHEWTQTAGPTATIIGSGDGHFELTAPSVSETTTLEYELVVSTELASSEPAILTVTVNNKKKSGGGAGGLGILLLAGLLGVFRSRWRNIPA